VPRLSEFYGIAIYMYFRDHAPAHFHAIYGSHEALVEIESGATLRGGLPRRAESLVDEWLTLHRQELLDNWERARRPEPLQPIEPLR
jgi:hypothetical protein